MIQHQAMTEAYTYNLEAYANRIGYGGKFEPTLAVLQDIALAHASHIPFESLDVLLGNPILLDPASLENKLVTSNRGGYCFEQNGLMLGVLAQIGFQVQPLSGRVRIFSTRDQIPGRTHLFVKVTIAEEDYFFDVGVGGFSLTSPIKSQLDVEQETLHETRRIVKFGASYFHQAWTGSTWLDVVEFTGELMPPIDREIGSWWTSTSPKANFRQNLICAVAEPGGYRKALQNSIYTRRKGPDVVSKIIVESANHLIDILDQEFNLRFPADTRFGSGAQPWPTQ